MFALKRTTRLYPTCVRMSEFSSRDSTGRDSGGQGTIRQAGGAFGKMEVAKEEEYFYKQRQEQLHQLKEKKVDEQAFRESAIEQHKEAIKRHQQAIEDMSK